MFTRILVPLDGSARAERALPVAARIARASTASPAPRIVLVRAVPVPVTYGLIYEREALLWRIVRDETEEAQTYLSGIARSAQVADLPVESIVQVGSAANIILEAADNRGVDLVVMTSHGHTGLKRWVLGSVAEHVVHHARPPVLVLRGPDDATVGITGTNEDRPLCLLVPLDGSPLAETALAPACALALSLAAPRQASIHLVLVVAPYKAVPTNMPDALIMDGAKAYLERVAHQMLTERAAESTDDRLMVTWSVVAITDIAHGILATAEAREHAEGATVEGATAPGRCDAIAMATHGAGGLARWTLGSVTERVLHATQLPILIVRPQAVELGHIQ